jgi:hypothetical protein
MTPWEDWEDWEAEDIVMIVRGSKGKRSKGGLNSRWSKERMMGMRKSDGRETGGA